MKAFGKLTTIVDGEPRITGDPPLIVPIEDVAGDQTHRLDEFLRSVIRSYRRTLAGDRRKLLERFRYVHAARKVVGVGSVGTRAWICLMLGRDGEDPLFLQFKEAQPSVLEPFLGRSEFANSGQRVVEGQRLTQAASDIMLGWIKIEGIDGVKRDFYIRQLWDAKMSALVELMEPRTMSALRTRLRDRARPRPCAGGRRRRDRELPRHGRHVRPRAGDVRGDLRRPERARLRGAEDGGRGGPGQRGVRALSSRRRRSGRRTSRWNRLGLHACRSALSPPPWSSLPLSPQAAAARATAAATRRRRGVGRRALLGDHDLDVVAHVDRRHAQGRRASRRTRSRARSTTPRARPTRSPPTSTISASPTPRRASRPRTRSTSSRRDLKTDMPKIQDAVDGASGVSGILTAVSVVSSTLVTMGNQVSTTSRASRTSTRRASSRARSSRRTADRAAG